MKKIVAIGRGGVGKSTFIALMAKYFKDIKATDTKFNGRGSENIIILRAGK